MSLGCWRAGRLLAARKIGLSEAERLWLEEHLQGCDTCRADARALDALVQLAARAEGESIGDRALSRAVNMALREGAAARAPRTSRPMARIVLSLSIAAAAAGAGVLAWTSLRGGTAPTVASAAPKTVPAGEMVQLAHADVLLDPGGAAEWDASATTVHLHSGRVTVHVDKTVHRPFRVATDRFVVEVTGTRFVVAADSVEVREGSVRVLSLDGTPLAESISAGGRWQIKEASAATPGAPETAAPAASAPDTASPPAAVPAPPALPPSSLPPVPARTPRVSVGPLLDDARRVLAHGDAREARHLVGRALENGPSRAERAEAETLLAEVTLVEGDHAGAAERYARVAERYADLPAGENALYAAASLAARSGRADEARTLARRYLERYPHGRFHSDAEGLRDRAGREAP